MVRNGAQALRLKERDAYWNNHLFFRKKIAGFLDTLASDEVMNENAETLLLAGKARSTINGYTSKVAPVIKQP